MESGSGEASSGSGSPNNPTPQGGPDQLTGARTGVRGPFFRLESASCEESDIWGICVLGNRVPLAFGVRWLDTALDSCRHPKRCRATALQRNTLGNPGLKLSNGYPCLGEQV